MRGQLHFPGEGEAGEDRFTHARRFAGRKLRDAGDVTVRAKTAQLRFQLVGQRERRRRRLRGVGFFLVGDAHLKLRRHRVMVENVDFTHG